MSFYRHHDLIRVADLDLFFEDNKIAIDITEHNRGKRGSEALIHYSEVDKLITALATMRDVLAVKYATKEEQ